MKFYQPKFQIATLEAPQAKFQSKFGGLPWGLPAELWCRCQDCQKPMSLLAQLSHDPPALDFGVAEQVLHLFQCQECFGYETGQGNLAVFISSGDLGSGLSDPPEPLDRMVGEFNGPPPKPDEVGGMVVVINPDGRQEYHEPTPKKKMINAPWSIVSEQNGTFAVEITNLGTDGTAYVFITSALNPPEAYWFWNR